jgi:hypothetical protein
MDQKAFFRQMIEFNRMTFDNTFNAMVMVQEQNERMAKALQEQATWLPKEARNAIEEWMNAYKKGRDQYKKLVDESFEKVASFFK